MRAAKTTKGLTVDGVSGVRMHRTGKQEGEPTRKNTASVHRPGSALQEQTSQSGMALRSGRHLGHASDPGRTTTTTTATQRLAPPQRRRNATQRILDASIRLSRASTPVSEAPESSPERGRMPLKLPALHQSTEAGKAPRPAVTTMQERSAPIHHKDSSSTEESTASRSRRRTPSGRRRGRERRHGARTGTSKGESPRRSLRNRETLAPMEKDSTRLSKRESREKTTFRNPKMQEERQREM